MARRHLDHDWFPEPLPENVILGSRNWLYSSFAFRHFSSQRAVAVRTGHDTGLYDGTFFDLGPSGEVTIGNFCSIVGAIFCSNSRIEIQDYVFIAHEVVLADTFDCIPAWESSRSERNQTPPTIIVGKNAWIGARAVLLAGARIGVGSIVGAAAVVDFEVPPYKIVAGNPARIVRSIPRDTNRFPTP